MRFSFATLSRRLRSHSSTTTNIDSLHNNNKPASSSPSSSSSSSSQPLESGEPDTSSIFKVVSQFFSERADEEVEISLPLAQEISSSSQAGSITRRVKKSQIHECLEPSEVLRCGEVEVRRLMDSCAVPSDVAWAACDKLGWRNDEVKAHLKETRRKTPASSQLLLLSKEGRQPEGVYPCDICGSEVDMAATMKLSLCPDLHRFCLGCWGGYATAMVKDGKVPVPCMAPNCENTLADVALLRDLLDKETFELFQYLFASSFINKTKKMKWCSSPFCNKAVQLKADQKLDTKARCTCGTPYCGACGNEWHAPVDCQTYQAWTERNFADGESTRWLATFTRPCPNMACQRAIEKNGGCPHMHCKACDSHFCWTCMKLYENGNHPKCGPEVHTANMLDVQEFAAFQNAIRGFDVCATKDATVTTLLEVANKKAGNLKKSNGATTASFEEAVWVFVDHLRILRFSYVLIYHAQRKPELFSVGLEFMYQLQTELLRSLFELRNSLMDEEEGAQANKEKTKKLADQVVERGKSLGLVARGELSSSLLSAKK